MRRARKRRLTCTRLVVDPFFGSVATRLDAGNAGSLMIGKELVSEYEKVAKAGRWHSAIGTRHLKPAGAH